MGLFQSRQKFAFLPFSESDFILSIIGEEVGFVGLIALFALLFFIIFRGIRIASRSKNVFGYLMAVGITMIFGIQVVVNAIIVFMAGFGILYNISKHNREENLNEELFLR